MEFKRALVKKFQILALLFLVACGNSDDISTDERDDPPNDPIYTFLVKSTEFDQDQSELAQAETVLTESGIVFLIDETGEAYFDEESLQEALAKLGPVVDKTFPELTREEQAAYHKRLLVRDQVIDLIHAAQNFHDKYAFKAFGVEYEEEDKILIQNLSQMYIAQLEEKITLSKRLLEHEVFQFRDDDPGPVREKEGEKSPSTR